MLTEIDVACDLLEENGFDDVAAFLKSAISGEDYENEFNAREEAEKTLDELNKAIDGTRSRYAWTHPSAIDQLLEVINEWRDRKDRIEELEARVRELENDRC